MATSTVNAAHIDGNQHFSMTGVIGSLGTADVSGTALTLPIGVDPATGAVFVNILAGAGAASNPTSGTLSTLGTVGTVPGIGTITNIGTIGSIVGMPASTLALNTGTLTTIAAGTQNTLGTVGTVPGIGTITNIGTIGSIVGMPASTLALNTGTLTTIAAGTQNTLGTVGTIPGVGTLTNLGSITNIGSIAAGILTSVGSIGTVLGIAGGSITNIGSIAAGVLTSLGTLPGQGTLTNLGSVTNIGSIAAGILTSVTSVGSVPGIGTLTNLGSVTNIGSIAAGVLTSLGTLPGQGTLTNVGSLTNFGTGKEITNIVGGTLTSVAINNKPAGSIILTSSTLGTTGAAVWGTLIAPVGAGTYVYMCGCSIVVASGTVDVAVTTNVAGSTGAGVFARGQFVPGGGLDQDFIPPIQVGTNGTIAYWLGGAGTVAISTQYWVGP